MTEAERWQHALRLIVRNRDAWGRPATQETLLAFARCALSGHNIQVDEVAPGYDEQTCVRCHAWDKRTGEFRVPPEWESSG